VVRGEYLEETSRNYAYAKKAMVLPVEEESKEVCVKLIPLLKGPHVNTGADLRYDTEVRGLSTGKLADWSVVIHSLIL